MLCPHVLIDSVDFWCMHFLFIQKAGLFYVLTKYTFPYSSITIQPVYRHRYVIVCNYYLIIPATLSRPSLWEFEICRKKSVNLFKLVQLSSQIKICLHVSSPSRSKVHFPVSVFLWWRELHHSLPSQCGSERRSYFNI